jgi:membrane protein YqaA with SNARE-associated domain
LSGPHERQGGRRLGRGLPAVAFAWGFAEAVVFFFVPDVLLTLVACRDLKAALRGALWALAGALAGGFAMYVFGAVAPAAARSLLDAVPGIGPTLLARVDASIEARGLWDLLLGPLRGVPYKIYAVAWGARGGDLAAFLLVSIPARWLRFAATALVAAGLARLFARASGRDPKVEAAAWAALWLAFYVFYFSKLGW